MSPTIYQFNGIKIKIHANDHNPPHVHVEGKGCVAVFELNTMKLISNSGFSRSDIAVIEEAIFWRHQTLLEAWNEYHE